jgi:hypothetical protein
MRIARRRWGMIVALLLLLGAPTRSFAAEVLIKIPPGALPADFFDRLPEGMRHNAGLRDNLRALLSGYAGYCQGLALADHNRLYLIMKDNVRILYDDGKVKSFEEKLDHPDLEDMLSQIYPAGEFKEYKTDYDPGRFRVTAFFNSVYGGTSKQVQANLATVNFCGQKVQFNARNGAAAALGRVGENLAALIRCKPELRQYLFPLGGSVNWRTIAGTKRPSPHSWGIAFDLNPRHGAYWRWQKSPTVASILTLRQSYPQEIVKIFEAQGFIWGGKWSHYDFMHFEYRPELLAKTPLAGPANTKEPSKVF